MAFMYYFIFLPKRKKNEITKIINVCVLEAAWELESIIIIRATLSADTSGFYYSL